MKSVDIVVPSQTQFRGMHFPLLHLNSLPGQLPILSRNGVLAMGIKIGNENKIQTD